jgi:hypothetical protein
MKAEIDYEADKDLQVVELEDGKRAYIVDPDLYQAYLSNFPKRGTVVLERRNARRG